MEREVGGGIGKGNTCKPMAVSFQCMTRSTTIKNIYIYSRNILGKAERESKFKSKDSLPPQFSDSELTLLPC